MYEKVGWKDSPSKETPVNAKNLNKMDEEIFRLSQSDDTKTKEMASVKETSDQNKEDIQNLKEIAKKVDEIGKAEQDMINVTVISSRKKIGTYLGRPMYESAYKINLLGSSGMTAIDVSDMAGYDGYMYQHIPVELTGMLRTGISSTKMWGSYYPIGDNWSAKIIRNGERSYRLEVTWSDLENSKNEAVLKLRSIDIEDNTEIDATN